MPRINYEQARTLLDNTLVQVEADILNGETAKVDQAIADSCEIIFQSNTQAYREVLLGCIVARILDKSINIRQPYMKHGPNAFNGRTLDERVINPFLRDNRIPCSRAPYLSTFRRGVQIIASTAIGVRDQLGFEAMLAVISSVEGTDDDEELMQVLKHIIHKFLELREASHIALVGLHRISLPQYDSLITGLLGTPSGGRFPVLLVVAVLTAIKQVYDLDWEIQYQGINVSDAASGMGGDITVSSGGQILMAAEVTERRIDRSRMVATFTTKIAPARITDYLFFVSSDSIAPEARQLARRYFAQGHEVNFLEIKNWILNTLATINTAGRDMFNQALLTLLDEDQTPNVLKVAWNEQIERLAESSEA